MISKKIANLLVLILICLSSASDANEVERVQAGIKRCFGNEGINNMLIAKCHGAATKEFVSMIENRMNRIERLFALAESKGKSIALTIDEAILFKSYRERAIKLQCQLFGYRFEPGIPMCLSDGYSALAKDMDHLESKIKELVD